MDDKPGEAEGDAPWYARGKGILSREEAQAAARFALALREAARGLARVGGTRWALAVLREEMAELEAPAKRSVGRPPRAARASDLELTLLAEAWRGESAPKLAARLHLAAPGEHGATPGAIEKRIKTYRALSPERREAFRRAAFSESCRAFVQEARESGELSAEHAEIFAETLAMVEAPADLNAETRAFLADLLRGAGWGNQSN